MSTTVTTVFNMVDFAPYHDSGFQLLLGSLDQETVCSLRSEARLKFGEAQTSRTDSLTAPKVQNILSAKRNSAAPVEGRLSLQIEHLFRYSDAFRRVVHHPRLVGIVRAIAGTQLR